jgi:hypothetical protein
MKKWRYTFALLPVKDYPVTIEYEAVCVTEPIWVLL